MLLLQQSAVAHVHLVLTECCNIDVFALLKECITMMTSVYTCKCSPTINLSSRGCLIPRKDTTDMDGPITCSLLTIQSEKQPDM